MFCVTLRMLYMSYWCWRK